MSPVITTPVTRVGATLSSKTRKKEGMIMVTFQPNMLPLLIGSLPIDNHDEAARLVFDATPEIPLWVQLPVFAEEGMMVQFLSGIPGVKNESERVFIDTSISTFEDDLLTFYEDYLSVTDGGAPLDGTRFAMTPATAPGFFTFVDAVRNQGTPPVALKGQITGPVTLATGVTDQNRRAIFYDDRLLDVAVKTLSLKARWQVEHMAAFGKPAIVFIDEPALAGFGTSAFATIAFSDVQRVLGEVIDTIHGAGGLAGVHVCANTDWSLILESQADILSFDAYGYFDRLMLYRDALKKFLDAGRILAWGIVPTASAEEIDKVDVPFLCETLESQMRQLENLGISGDILKKQSLITPSCGTGSLSREHAMKVLDLTAKVSNRFRS
jgi:methionine synthase II (cobalamin-independent)